MSAVVLHLYEKLNEATNDNARIEIKQIEINFSKTAHQQTLWVIGSVGTIIAAVRLLEKFLAHLVV